MNTQTIEVNQMIAKYLTVEGIKLENEKVVVGLDFYGMSFLLTLKIFGDEEYQLDYANDVDADNDTDSLFDSLMEVLDNDKYYSRLCKVVAKYLNESEV